MGRGAASNTILLSDHRPAGAAAPALPAGRWLTLQSLQPAPLTVSYLTGQLAGFEGEQRRVLTNLVEQLQAGRWPLLLFEDSPVLVNVVGQLDDDDLDPHGIIFELKMELLYEQPLLPDGYDQTACLRPDERYLLEAEIPLEEEDLEEEDLEEGGFLHEVEIEDGRAVIVKFFDPDDFELETGLCSAELTSAGSATAELLAFAVADAMGEPYRSIATPIVVREVLGRDALVSAHRWGGHVRKIAEPVSPRLARQLRAAALFDAVIGEPDRHNRNWVLDPQSEQIGAFDQAHSLHSCTLETDPGDFISWRLQHAPQLDTEEIAMLERIERSAVLEQIGFYLGEQSAARMRLRLRRMIESGQVDDGRNLLVPTDMPLAAQDIDDDADADDDAVRENGFLTPLAV